MSKPILAVDIDEVLVPHFQDLIDWYNNEYGTRLTLADNHPKSTENWGTDSVEEAVRRVHRFYETDNFKLALPVEEAKASLAKLSRKYDLVVVTARDTLIEQSTRQWLDKHFAELIREAHITPRYNLEGKNRTKAEVCAEIGAAYLRDDDLGNLVGALKVGTKGVLFGDFPWSPKDKLPDGIAYCADWAGVVEFFDGQN
jgi:5'(3')-deoxyribonucleotidase